MNYKIFQLSENAPKGLMFNSYNGDTFNINNYKQVYSGYIESSGNIIKDLDDIFVKFNVNHPSDFIGHSLSVSDIIELDGTKYYVDDIGFTKL